MKATAVALTALLAVAMVLLGNWQLRRLDWKLALIDRVETRAYETPVAAPVGTVRTEDHEYLRVAIEGRFRHELSQRVKALTELGGGYWLMTPLETARGAVWINRGFVPTGTRATDWQQPTDEQRVEGLVRMTEPKGTLLERNDPAAGRWVSRDVAALSDHAGLKYVQAYFVDADHAGDPDDWPRGGLTKLRFRNTHLAYALTWYAMAALFAAAVAYVVFARPATRDPARS
ncbi:MAG: SURF1 family protein [Pseudomonadota bacterium]